MTTSGSHYKPVPVATNSTVIIKGSRILGFVPTAAGSWTFTIRQEGVPDLVLPAIPVAANTVGLLHELPIFVGTTARTSVTTSNNGAGILLTS